jgi:putative oxidoreductase
LLARLVFAAVLFPFFWDSARTKFSDGFPFPSDGAYIQIFPKAFEAAGYDSSQMGAIYHLIVFFGSYAEYLLPLLVTIGLFSRLSAIAMLGFVFVMTLTDLFGHGAALGQWFNNDPYELIADQRSLWVIMLLCVVSYGGGWLSVDRFIGSRTPSEQQG